MIGRRRTGWAPMVSDFQELVYRACAAIPLGKVATYRDIAIAIGSSEAVRAVGNALNRNPFPPAHVPCHRVVRSDGRIGGYARGAGEKARLLRSEGVVVDRGTIDLARFGIKRNCL